MTRGESRLNLPDSGLDASHYVRGLGTRDSTKPEPERLANSPAVYIYSGHSQSGNSM